MDTTHCDSVPASIIIGTMRHRSPCVTVPTQRHQPVEVKWIATTTVSLPRHPASGPIAVATHSGSPARPAGVRGFVYTIESHPGTHDIIRAKHATPPINSSLRNSIGTTTGRHPLKRRPDTTPSGPRVCVTQCMPPGQAPRVIHSRHAGPSRFRHPDDTCPANSPPRTSPRTSGQRTGDTHPLTAQHDQTSLETQRVFVHRPPSGPIEYRTPSAVRPDGFPLDQTNLATHVSSSTRTRQGHETDDIPGSLALMTM